MLHTGTRFTISKLLNILNQQKKVLRALCTTMPIHNVSSPVNAALWPTAEDHTLGLHISNRIW